VQYLLVCVADDERRETGAGTGTDAGDDAEADMDASPDASGDDDDGDGAGAVPRLDCCKRLWYCQMQTACEWRHALCLPHQAFRQEHESIQSIICRRL